jgi:hypothetical protein
MGFQQATQNGFSPIHPTLTFGSPAVCDWGPDASRNWLIREDQSLASFGTMTEDRLTLAD